jgi:hypothetical protein
LGIKTNRFYTQNSKELKAALKKNLTGKSLGRHFGTIAGSFQENIPYL